MKNNFQVPETVWKQLIATVESRVTEGPLKKPIAFALYTKEDDRTQVLRCQELPLRLKHEGTYPSGDYDYTWPGVAAAGFYMKPGSGQWFEGTWIFGDGLDLDKDDVRWMGKEETPVRVKVDRDANGNYQWKAYRLTPVEIRVELTRAT